MKFDTKFILISLMHIFIIISSLFSGTTQHDLTTSLSFKCIYYSFGAIMIFFLVIFEDDKSGNFLRGYKSFRTLKRSKSLQKQSK